MDEEQTEEQAYKYSLSNVEIIDTISEKDLLRYVFLSLGSMVYNGMKIEDLEDIVIEKFGITRPCCKELIEKIILELNLYTPDMKTLYFA
ncbi:hypothetical protein MSHOH_2134 [Methanosarcina horonobensis HB-1 = JCM 15518]|uniref:Uncharacterized protein n=2 Tax=Methanosarcina horonobensis TaxID=418008 RepID=A0A0E3SEK5_9EURY|nr:hypothetical protein MSHOH_2134 [Methanosarcina horonobensis HB-1 = JCM 15518]